jgi:hypothetical protein
MIATTIISSISVKPFWMSLINTSYGKWQSGWAEMAHPAAFFKHAACQQALNLSY